MYKKKWMCVEWEDLYFTLQWSISWSKFNLSSGGGLMGFYPPINYARNETKSFYGNNKVNHIFMLKTLHSQSENHYWKNVRNWEELTKTGSSIKMFLWTTSSLQMQNALIDAEIRNLVCEISSPSEHFETYTWMITKIAPPRMFSFFY